MSNNYPNMSYCMMGNTKLALEQVLEEMEEAQKKGREAEFLNDMNRDERRAWSDMYEMCQRFANMCEEMEQAQAAAAFEAAELEDDDDPDWNASEGQGA